MTNWLRKRLAVWAGVSLLGSALVWNSGALRAQNQFGLNRSLQLQSTPESVAKQFAGELRPSKNDLSLVPEQLTSLKSKGQVETIYTLLNEMTEQWNWPLFRIEIIKQGGKTATMLVNNALPPALPLILIEENGRWRVDLVATHAKWKTLVGPSSVEKSHSKLSRNDVAKIFVEGLIRRENRYCEAVTSDKSKRALQRPWKVDERLTAMAENWNRHHLEAKTNSENAETATLIIEDNSPEKPLVLVLEDGYWGVDIIETYARWNGKKSNAPDLKPISPRDQAATRFAAGMIQWEESDLPKVSQEPISAKTKQQLESKTYRLIEAMATQWNQPNLEATLQSKSGKTAVVLLKRKLPPVRPLVLVAENGTWGVDLVETYARWNDLKTPEEKAQVMLGISGVEIEGLPQDVTSQQKIAVLREVALRNSCMANAREIGLAVLQYSQDYDEIFPPAKSWTDGLKPYVKSKEAFHCPSLTKSQHFGYAFNSKLSGKELVQLSQPAKSVSIYESSILKPNAYGVGEGLAFRHQNGAHYAFADGHAQWFSRSQTPSFKLKP